MSDKNMSDPCFDSFILFSEFWSGVRSKTYVRLSYYIHLFHLNATSFRHAYVQREAGCYSTLPLDCTLNSKLDQKPNNVEAETPSTRKEVKSKSHLNTTDYRATPHQQVRQHFQLFNWKD